jgi:hypothetical protein
MAAEFAPKFWHRAALPEGSVDVLAGHRYFLNLSCGQHWTPIETRAAHTQYPKMGNVG